MSEPAARAELWTEQALCRTAGRNPNLWFPENRLHADAKRAKAICNVCPVREQCLREALSDDDTRGIWGGFDERERTAIRLRLKGGRRAI